MPYNQIGRSDRFRAPELDRRGDSVHNDPVGSRRSGSFALMQRFGNEESVAVPFVPKSFRSKRRALRTAALTPDMIDSFARSFTEQMDNSLNVLLSTSVEPATNAEGHQGAANTWTILASMIGSVEAPRDWAEQHDHYIHGTPKTNGA